MEMMGCMVCQDRKVGKGRTSAMNKNHSQAALIAYGWRAWNLNWPVRIQQAEKLYCPDIIVS